MVIESSVYLHYYFRFYHVTTNLESEQRTWRVKRRAKLSSEHVIKIDGRTLNYFQRQVVRDLIGYERQISKN